MKSKEIYAVYKGDNFIDLGTIEELAIKLKMTARTLKFHTYPCYTKRIKDAYQNRLIVIKIEK